MAMHPATVGVPAEVRSCMGRRAEEKPAQLRVAEGRGSLSLGAQGEEEWHRASPGPGAQ